PLLPDGGRHDRSARRRHAKADRRAPRPRASQNRVRSESHDVEGAVRTLIVSDLHANAEALRAILSRVRRKRLDRIACLGDFVGYGAQPNQVLDKMRMMKWRKFYVR